MKKIICLLPFAMSAAYAADPAPRMGLLSTSVDWEAVSGLRLSEYKITFSDTKSAKSGWEMYILDEFPCYGFAQYTRTWVSAKNSDGFLRMNCVRPPKQVKLAYREAGLDDYQARTTGILTCKVDKKQVIKLDDCTAETWSDFARE